MNSSLPGEQGAPLGFWAVASCTSAKGRASPRAPKLREVPPPGSSPSTSGGQPAPAGTDRSACPSAGLFRKVGGPPSRPVLWCWHRSGRSGEESGTPGGWLCCGFRGRGGVIYPHCTLTVKATGPDATQPWVPSQLCTVSCVAPSSLLNLSELTFFSQSLLLPTPPWQGFPETLRHCAWHPGEAPGGAVTFRSPVGCGGDQVCTSSVSQGAGGV